MSNDKVIISAEKAENIIRKTFGDGFADNFSLHISDEKYYCPSLDDVDIIIQQYADERPDYTNEVYDCDDFALALKYFFIKHAYKNGKRRAPHCMGMIWGEVLGEGQHAVNFVIDNDLKLSLIDPQKDEILIPDETDREITFIYL